MTVEKSWKTWLFPGGVLLAIAAVVVNTSLLARLTSSLDFLYFAVFAAGLLLAWRFNSSRVMFSLLVLLLGHRALEFFSSGTASRGPGYSAAILIGVLIPLNAILLAHSQERGLTIAGVAPRFGLLFIESVLVTLICRPAMNGLFVPAARTFFELLVFGSFAIATVLAVVRFHRNRRPMEIGIAWSLIAAYLWLESPLGSAGELYIATAGLVLAVSLIETSYVLAYHDELTGIPGRRAFNESLLSLDQQYVVAIADIDHFKKFNDTYGHETGDQVLRMVASRLAAVGAGGQAYRCGGEEFAIVFRNMSAKDAAESLEELRKTVEHSKFRVRRTERRQVPRAADAERRKGDRRKAATQRVVQTGPETAEVPAELSVTVSIGLAEPNARLRETEQVIEAADQALYVAKRSGRNRVEIASAATPKPGRSKRSVH